LNDRTDEAKHSPIFPPEHPQEDIREVFVEEKTYFLTSIKSKIVRYFTT
jgi:hypothetical protein